MPDSPFPPGFAPPIDPARTFDAVFGLEMDEPAADGSLTGRFPVTPLVLGEAGVLQSGVVAAAAEALSSWATILVVLADGAAGQGLSNDTTLLADVREGTVTVVARPVHRAPAQWTFVCEARDDAGELCALSRVIIAVRPLRG